MMMMLHIGMAWLTGTAVFAMTGQHNHDDSPVGLDVADAVVPSKIMMDEMPENAVRRVMEEVASVSVKDVLMLAHASHRYHDLLATVDIQRPTRTTSAQATQRLSEVMPRIRTLHMEALPLELAHQWSTQTLAKYQHMTYLSLGGTLMEDTISDTLAACVSLRTLRFDGANFQSTLGLLLSPNRFLAGGSPVFRDTLSALHALTKLQEVTFLTTQSASVALMHLRNSRL